MAEVRVLPEGRSLYATRDIDEDEEILSEDALVSCQFSWNSVYKYISCDQCMKPLETAEENVRRLSGNQHFELPHPELSPTKKEDHVVCPECGVAYCSEVCRRKALESYHQTLCPKSRQVDPAKPLTQLNDAWKQMHFPPETATVMLVARILAMLKQHPHNDQLRNVLKMFCHKTMEEELALGHKLLGQQFAIQIVVLRSLAAEAFPDPELEEFLTPDGFRALFALIGRNSQGIGTSPISQWVKAVEESDLPDDEKEALDTLIDKIYEDMEKESGTFLNSEGSGLYVTQSAANHSCEPNAIATFPHNNYTVSLVATRPVKKGEEIFISYLDECALSRSRHSRQKELRENYLFHCKCPKCEREIGDPDVTSDEDEYEDMSD